MINNPWKSLPSSPPYFAKDDEIFVKNFNTKFGHNNYVKLQLDSIPEPYVGDLTNSRLICLLSNPGHSVDDPIAHQDSELRKAILTNHLQLKTDYPFFPLNPIFSNWPVGQYWNKKLRGLLEHFSNHELSQHFALIEYHPYHSYRFGGSNWLEKNPFPSQKYTDDILLKIINDSNRMIFVLRKHNNWLKRFPTLKNRAHFHKNPANISFTRNNLGIEIFDKIIGHLKG